MGRNGCYCVPSHTHNKAEYFIGTRRPELLKRGPVYDLGKHSGPGLEVPCRLAQVFNPHRLTELRLSACSKLFPGLQIQRFSVWTLAVRAKILKVETLSEAVSSQIFYRSGVSRLQLV